MESPAPVTRGVGALHRLLREQDFDVRGLDLAGFRAWLGRHLEHWRHDPVFLQRARIRDLRRDHPDLATLEKEYHRAAVADAAAPRAARLDRIARELADTEKAVAGLATALQRASDEKRPALRRKLRTFHVRHRALRAEQAALVRSSPERRALLSVRDELQRLRAAVGLDREEATLATLLRQKGRRSGTGGAAFERLAVDLTSRLIVPGLARAAQGLRVLLGVRLGTARTEFDQLVVRPPRRSGQPVEVLAVVEAKRNVNDLAHGFRQRQADVAWLTGETAAYDPAMYRTRHFPSGHFDRAALHTEAGEPFVFDRGSFRRFRRDAATPFFLDRLYFITRAGAMWGISAAALARISFRVATDERWDPDDDAYLRRLLRWSRSLAGPFETPDLLRLYGSSVRRARQILIAGR